MDAGITESIGSITRGSTMYLMYQTIFDGHVESLHWNVIQHGY